MLTRNQMIAKLDELQINIHDAEQTKFIYHDADTDENTFIITDDDEFIFKLADEIDEYEAQSLMCNLISVINQLFFVDREYLNCYDYSVFDTKMMIRDFIIETLYNLEDSVEIIDCDHFSFYRVLTDVDDVVYLIIDRKRLATQSTECIFEQLLEIIETLDEYNIKVMF